jgi:putative ABC transport system permease protein
MYHISLSDLLLGFVPVLITLFVIFKWSLSLKKAMYSVARMLIQLLLIGYALNFIFSTNSAYLVTLVLSLMLFAASWISLSSLDQSTRQLFLYSLSSIFIGGVFTLIITTQGVLHLQPWYDPKVIIPIAGMIFSNSMNTISIAAERFFSEQKHSSDFYSCRDAAYQAALIPIFNSLMAVGLVSLPGMMTGQILSGVSPLIAARYQIMVMLMIMGSSGISAALFLTLIKRQLKPIQLPTS